MGEPAPFCFFEKTCFYGCRRIGRPGTGTEFWPAGGAEVMMYRDSYRKLRKGFALLIAVCMLTVMIPAGALAAGDEDGIKTADLWVL